MEITDRILKRGRSKFSRIGDHFPREKKNRLKKMFSPKVVKTWFYIDLGEIRIRNLDVPFLYIKKHRDAEIEPTPLTSYFHEH